MKIAPFILLFIFIFNACQTRGMPMHPSFQKKIIKTTSPNKEVTIKDTEEKGNTKNFLTLKLKSKALNKDNSLLSSIPIVKNILPELNEIPIIRNAIKLLPEGSKKSKKRVKKKYAYLKSESFSGGTVSDGLDMGMVRLGQSRTYSKIIFDTYKWQEGELPTQRSNHSGTYIFTYEPSKNRIVAIVDGYRAFSALAGDQSALYQGNPIVETIHLQEYLDDSGFKFVIKLKQHVKIYVYELHNPGRIIVDLILP